MEPVVNEARALEHPPVQSPPWAGITLPDLFAASVQANPQAAAFRWHGESGAGGVKTMTFATAERAVQRMAEQFGDIGLQPGHVVVISVAGTWEAPLVLLAALRAGLTPCLASPTLPLDAMTGLLAQAGVGAVVTVGTAGTLRPAECWRSAAAAAGGGRFVLAFGSRLPGGVLPLDGLFASAADAGFAATGQRVAAQPPVLTTTLVDGQVAVARHEQDGLVAAGLLLVVRAGMASAEPILTTLAPVSHAGLVTGLVPALLTGATLWQIPTFGAAAFLAAVDAMGRGHVVAPAAVQDAMVTAGVARGARSCILLHRPVAQFETRPAPGGAAGVLVDALACGEQGLLVGRRSEDGASTLAVGESRVPDADGALVIRAEIGPGGRIYLAGAAVPTRMDMSAGSIGVSETGLVCRTDGRGRILSVTPS
jgi:hypothetical protein